MVQVLLWLTASLPASASFSLSSTSSLSSTVASNNNNETIDYYQQQQQQQQQEEHYFDLYLHLLFFCNLLGILIPSLLLLLLHHHHCKTIDFLVRPQTQTQKENNNNNNNNPSTNTAAVNAKTHSTVSFFVRNVCLGCCFCPACIRYGCGATKTTVLDGDRYSYNTNNDNDNDTITNKKSCWWNKKWFLQNLFMMIVLQLTPLSVWIAMVVVTVSSSFFNTTSTSTVTTWTYYIIGVVWVVGLVIWMYGEVRSKQQQQQQQSYYYIPTTTTAFDHTYPLEPQLLFSPTTTTNNYNYNYNYRNAHNANAAAIAHLDESMWPTWTVQQFMEWLIVSMDTTSSSNSSSSSSTTTFPSSSNNNNNNGTGGVDVNVVWLLAWQGIDGRSIEYLDRNALRDMGIPYGVAAPLLEHIQTRLIQRYPKMVDRQSGHQYDDAARTMMNVHDSCHVEDDDDDSRENNQQWRQQHYPLQNADSSRLFNNFLDENELEQIRNSMKERYGFELPDLADPFTAAARGNSRQNETGVDNKPPTLNPNLVTDEQSEGSFVPVSSSQTMPPHIRSIVEEKPELWQQIQTTQMPPMSPSAVAPQHSPEMSSTSHDTAPPKIAPEILQNLPPRVKEVALRNPAVFLKMLDSQKEKPIQQPVQTLLRIQEHDAEETDDEECVHLLPKADQNSKDGRLRQRW